MGKAAIETGREGLSAAPLLRPPSTKETGGGETEGTRLSERGTSRFGWDPSRGDETQLSVFAGAAVV